MIKQIVERKRLTQTQVAAALGINQSKVSDLLNHSLESFSIERLMHFLVALGRDVEIVLKSKPTYHRARIPVKGV